MCSAREASATLQLQSSRVLECQTQVSGFGVVRRQGLQNVIGERTQFALVRLEREESVYTEFVEVCDLPRPVDTSADDHGCTGLVVGRG